MTAPELPWTDCPAVDPLDDELDLDGCPGCHGCLRREGHRCHRSAVVFACMRSRPDDPLRRGDDGSTLEP